MGPLTLQNTERERGGEWSKGTAGRERGWRCEDKEERER